MLSQGTCKKPCETNFSMNQKSMDETKQFLSDPEISIWIDKYDDVFSDYDSRTFAERALSDDFLRELHKMISEKKTSEVQLKFHLLNDQSNSEWEEVIKNNLRSHFKNVADVLKDEKKQILNKGYRLLGIGFALILFIFYLTINAESGVYLHGIILMLEPVGWFTTWTGLDLVFQTSRKDQSTLDFNTKMASAQITFSSFAAVQETDTETPRQKSVIPMDNNNLRVA